MGDGGSGKGMLGALRPPPGRRRKGRKRNPLQDRELTDEDVFTLEGRRPIPWLNTKLIQTSKPLPEEKSFGT